MLHSLFMNWTNNYTYQIFNVKNLKIRSKGKRFHIFISKSVTLNISHLSMLISFLCFVEFMAYQSQTQIPETIKLWLWIKKYCGSHQQIINVYFHTKTFLSLYWHFNIFRKFVENMTFKTRFIILISFHYIASFLLIFCIKWTEGRGKYQGTNISLEPRL